MTYGYQTLPSGRFVRLLQLHPGSWADALSGALSVVDLDSNPSYDAVSYEWGTFAASREILIDGHGLPIRSNLHSLLLRLRQRHTSRLLWIDAICINQQVTNERNHQVQLMGLIYGGASEVLVWLGSGSQRVLLAMRSLGREASTLSWLNGQLLGCLERLFTLRYWTRTWIIQEIVLAKRISLFYGEMKIAWSRLEDAFEGLKRREAQSKENMLQAIPFKLIERRRQFRSGTLRLFQLLTDHCLSSCADPRDKVYALLGLALDYPGNPPLFEVDYHKDPLDLFREVICFCKPARTLLPKFACLLQRSLGISPLPDGSNVLLDRAYFEKQPLLQELYYSYDGHRKWVGWRPSISDPSFLVLDGIRVGDIFDGDRGDAITTDLMFSPQLPLENPDLPYRCSRQELLELCLKSVTRAPPAYTIMYDRLLADCRRTASSSSWVTMSDLDSLHLEGLGLKLVYVRTNHLSRPTIGLGIAPLHASTGNVIVVFDGYPTAFFAEAQPRSGLLGPVYLIDRVLESKNLKKWFSSISEHEKFAWSSFTWRHMEGRVDIHFSPRICHFRMSFSELQNAFY